MFYAAWPPMCFLLIFLFFVSSWKSFPFLCLSDCNGVLTCLNRFCNRYQWLVMLLVGQKIEGNIPIVELIQPLATLTFPRSPVNNARCQGALFRPSISRVCFFIIHECLELSMKHQRFSITLHILVFLWRIHSLQPPDLFYSHHSCLQGRHHQNLLRGTATKR